MNIKHAALGLAASLVALAPTATTQAGWAWAENSYSVEKITVQGGGVIAVQLDRDVSLESSKGDAFDASCTWLYAKSPRTDEDINRMHSTLLAAMLSGSRILVQASDGEVEACNLNRVTLLPNQ